MEQMNILAEKIFSILKGNELKIKIFDVDGNDIVDPTLGRRFFVASPNIMVTLDEENNSIEFSKSSDVKGPAFNNLWKKISELADASVPPVNTSLKTFGKSFEPRDHAYKAKMHKDTPMMENNTLKPHNHHLLGQIMNLIKAFSGKITVNDLTANLGNDDMSEIQPILNRLVSAGKLECIPHNSGNPNRTMYSKVVDEAIMEVSTGKLAKYKSAASSDASKADASGDFKRGDKRMHGIVKATKKQFDNDAKPKQNESIQESFSKMFGSLKTSHQMLENVRILVRHRTPVDENVRGSRSRHISAIFLECNGERMRFQHNYLPGARAMAQHMAHGGAMTDKVGGYISESTGQLLKLQSFNRYVTTNKLINEDSSGIVDTVKENIETLKMELKKLTGSKTYETAKARLETFEREQLDEDDTSQLKDLFTVRRFDEKFEEVLPIIKQLVQEKDTYHKRIEESAGSSIILRRDAISAPPMFEFASENARLGFKLNELALRIVENEELAGFINKIGTKMCKEGIINDFERAVLTQVFENVKIAEPLPTSQSIMKETINLDAFFDRYIVNFF